MTRTRKTRGVLGALKLCGLGLGLGLAALVRAETFDWSINAGAEHSDNIRRTSVDEESETIAEAGVQLDVNAERPRLSADVAANLSYRDYLDNTFDNETVGGIDGTVTFGLVPNRFTWLVKDNFTQVATDVRAVDTPANRQGFNYLTTGPDFIFHLGTRTSLTVQGRWSDVYFEDTADDNQQLGGGLSLSHQMSEHQTLSLNAYAVRVEYDQIPPGSDYDLQEAFLRYEAGGLRTTLTTDLGYAVLHDNGESNNGVLARLSLTRKVATRSTVKAEVGTEFADTANTIRLDQSFGDVPLETSGAATSSDPYKADYVYLSWQTSGERSTIELGGTWRDESHERETSLDRTYVEGRMDLSRRLGNRVIARLFGGYSNDDFDTSVDIKEWSMGAGVSWQFGQNLSLELRATHIEGSGSGGDTRDYDENRTYLGLSYSGGK